MLQYGQMSAENTRYKWIICACSTFILFINVGFTSSAFGIHMPYIFSSGWFSNSGASLIITVKTFTNLIAIMLADRAVGRFGLRKILAAALAAGTAGFAFMGAASSAAAAIQGRLLYYSGGALLGIASGLGGFMVISILIRDWFSEGVGLALGVCSAGSGIALFVLPRLVTGLISAAGLDAAFFAEAALEFSAMLLALFLIRDLYGDSGNDGNNDSEGPGQDVLQGTASDRGIASVSSIDGLHAAAAASMFLTGFASNIPNYFTMLYIGAGYDDAVAADLYSLMGVILTIWKLLFGRLNDRFGTRRCMAVSYAFLTAGCLLACMCVLHSSFVNAAAVFALAIGLITTTVLISCLAIDLSTREGFARMLKLMNTGFWAGILVSSYVMGWLADLFGNYIPSFAVCGIVSLAALLLLCAVFSKRFNRGGNR